MLRAKKQENNDQMANSNQSNMQCRPVFTESKLLGDNSNHGLWPTILELELLIGGEKISLVWSDLPKPGLTIFGGLQNNSNLKNSYSSKH